MNIKTTIGLMSGTSMDGIDVALVHTDGETFIERGPMGFYPYASDSRKLLELALEDAKGIDERNERLGCLKQTEAQITQLHVEAVKLFLKENNLKASQVDVLGFHGQTVLHRPDEALTLQLGNGDILAQETGIDVVFDMRANDMMHGGQGAPLIPVYHQALSAILPKGLANQTPVVFVNIGGISNITYVGEELIAFDTGPGNTLIDQWVQREVGISYDQGGAIAAEGEINHVLAEKYLSNPYLEKPLPKSLDRNDFLPPSSQETTVEEGARTLAYVSATAIMKSVEHLPVIPKLWIICGGGRHNPHIMADLKLLANDMSADVISAETAGFDGDAMEAEAWGYLAVRSLMGLPLTYPGTTGCAKPVTGGRFGGAT